MADPSHFDILEQSVKAWNSWRERNPSIDPNLSGAYFLWANLTEADLSGAHLTDADLKGSVLVETNLTATTLTGCSIYGISAWSLKLDGATQHSLNISSLGEPAITVDNLEVAQFIYLLLNNERIRQVIDTITSKVVLILGRFTSERKDVLDAIRDSLRQHDYLPVLFDFDRPTSRDLTETISTLAHMARFIIADITEAKSIPQELQAIVPNLPSVPVQPLLLNSDREYGMFEHFRRYPWVLDTYYYDNLDDVLASVADKVISPAEAKASELSR
jgi:Pentapeptide repeats (8 copies)